MNPVIVIAAVDGAIAVLKMVAELGAQPKRDSAWTAEQEAEFDAKMNMAFQQPWWKPVQP